MYADGSLNPEQAGAGVIAVDWRGIIVAVATQTLPSMTNNEAEYAALMLALHLATTASVQVAEIRMDSEIVVNQMEGRYNVNSPKLKLLHIKACAMMRQIPKVRCVTIRRELNEVADALARDAAAGRRWQMGES